MLNAIKQNSFSRLMINDLKMGAYYTDISMCRRIGHLFQFPEEEVCILEPSIGDGSAVCTVTGKVFGDSKKIFGVEINTKTFEEIGKNQNFSYLLNADFLNGVKISHNAFSFCFANPPYGDMEGKNERYETRFVDKISSYLMKDAYFAIVIPFYTLQNESFAKSFFSRYLPEGVFRFDDEVYETFKQIVLVGKKRMDRCFFKDKYLEFLERVGDLEKIPYLPHNTDEREPFVIGPSYEKDIEFFTTLSFDAKKAGENLTSSSLYTVIGNKAMVSRYMATELGNPPVPLKKDLLYLCALSGGGQGLVGNEENDDLHLQRGVTKLVKESRTEIRGEQKMLVESSFSKVCLNIIQNDGTITVLE